MSLTVWLVAACGGQPSSSRDPAAQAASAEPACAVRAFEGSRFTVCPYHADRDELRLAWKGRDGVALRGFDALDRNLGKDVARLHFAMNAGMFDEQGTPIGLYVERGKQLKPLNLNAGPGNFHMKPNGVLAVGHDGRVSIKPSPAFKGSARKPFWATQSGPMLLIDGKLHPRFNQDGVSRLVRNGVGVKDARTADFVISEDGVSFGRFARFFRDALGCRNALFLDGSVSSLWDPASGRKDPSTQLGPLILVLGRSSASVQAAGSTMRKDRRD